MAGLRRPGVYRRRPAPAGWRGTDAHRGPAAGLYPRGYAPAGGASATGGVDGSRPPLDGRPALAVCASATGGVDGSRPPPDGWPAL